MNTLFNLPEQPSTSAPPASPADPEETLVLEKYHRLNKGHRTFVNSMMDSLCEVEDNEIYESIIGMTEYTKQLAAGYDPGEEFDDQGEDILLYKERIHPQTDCIFTVNGDSMEPDFHSGDKVMVQRLDENSELRFGEIGAFIVGNETYIKEYRKSGLRSLNKRYRVMHFTENDSVYLIGRVLGVLNPDAIVSYDDSVRYERFKKRLEETT